MVSQVSEKRLRFFGIEFRVIFYLITFLLAIIAWSTFKSSVWMGVLFFVLFVFSVLIIWLDYSYNWISLTSRGLVLQSMWCKKTRFTTDIHELG